MPTVEQSFFFHLSPHVLLPTVNCNVYPLFLDSFPFSTLSREFPKVTGNEWGHSLLRQLEQSHAFLICSDTILHLSPSLPRSSFLYTITLSILSASHSLIHTQQRHFTWDPQTSVSLLPPVPAPCSVCVYINVCGCLHVCELQSPLQCSCASGLHNSCHGEGRESASTDLQSAAKGWSTLVPRTEKTRCSPSVNVCSWN